MAHPLVEPSKLLLLLIVVQGTRDNDDDNSCHNCNAIHPFDRTGLSLPITPHDRRPKHPRSRSSKNSLFPALCPRKYLSSKDFSIYLRVLLSCQVWQLQWRTKLRLVIGSSVVHREPAARVDQGKSAVM